jgi:hypothetical protein
MLDKSVGVDSRSFPSGWFINRGLTFTLKSYRLHWVVPDGRFVLLHWIASKGLTVVGAPHRTPKEKAWLRRRSQNLAY